MHRLRGYLSKFNKSFYLCVEIVMFPQGPELVLSTHIPQRHLDVPQLQRLHVEAYGGDGWDKLPLPQFIEDGRLARPVQTQRDHSHFHLGTDVDSVVLCEGDGQGGIQVELLGAKVCKLFLLGFHVVKEQADFLGGQQHTGVILPGHSVTLYAHLRHL